MKKILIWRQITPGMDGDIFNQTDYSKFLETSKALFDVNNCPNWGNKLWFQALYSTIVNENENEIVFRTNESIEEINEKYDLIIYPMANFFSTEYSAGMPKLAELFLKIRIPVYVIACGAQADRYSDLKSLVAAIGEPAKQFISAIYQTGGEFALRGYFTKAFFDALGFSSAVVTGCPSMYQMGAGFQIKNEKKDISELSPVVNGRIEYVKEIMKRYPHSVLMDQNMYFRCLYDPEYLKENSSLRSRILFSYNFDAYSASMLAENRIKMIADMGNWFTYLKKREFNYSIGSRIHGNIMSILCGIPATVLAIDTRTQEMAEFFDIPWVPIQKRETLSVKQMLKLYEEADYSKFNQRYGERYTAYEDFLKKHGIVSKINEHNRFFSLDDNRMDFETSVVNCEGFSRFARELRSQKLLIAAGCAYLDMKNRSIG